MTNTTAGWITKKMKTAEYDPMACIGTGPFAPLTAHLAITAEALRKENLALAEDLARIRRQRNDAITELMDIRQAHNQLRTHYTTQRQSTVYWRERFENNHALLCKARRYIQMLEDETQRIGRRLPVRWIRHSFQLQEETELNDGYDTMSQTSLETMEEDLEE